MNLFLVELAIGVLVCCCFAALRRADVLTPAVAGVAAVTFNGVVGNPRVTGLLAAKGSSAGPVGDEKAPMLIMDC